MTFTPDELRNRSSEAAKKAAAATTREDERRFQDALATFEKNAKEAADGQLFEAVACERQSLERNADAKVLFERLKKHFEAKGFATRVDGPHAGDRPTSSHDWYSFVVSWRPQEETRRSVRIVTISCYGRGPGDAPALSVPVEVAVEIRKFFGSRLVSVAPHACPHNTGGHGQRCKASYPSGVDKVDDGISCPYSFDYPYVKEERFDWTPPREIAAALEEVSGS